MFKFGEKIQFEFLFQDLVKKQKTELENITSFINNEKLQKGLEVYLESLKQKKKQ